MKIYCASDMHIGYEQTNYSKIEEFFNITKEKADELILCGDVLDLWRCEFKMIKKERKSTYEALLSVASEVPTTIIWGNHDYKLWRRVRLPIRITDDFVSHYDGTNIFFCHGWRFDLEQRFGHFMYDWLIDKFPYLYQTIFKKPSELQKEENKYSALSNSIHEKAESFRQKLNLDYVIMGHTHDPLLETETKCRVGDCGDFIDSLSYIVIENGKPKLERMKPE